MAIHALRSKRDEFTAIIVDSVRPRVAESAALARVSRPPKAGTLARDGIMGDDRSDPEVVCRSQDYFPYGDLNEAAGAADALHA